MWGKINFEMHSVKLTQSNVGKGKKPFSTKNHIIVGTWYQSAYAEETR